MNTEAIKVLQERVDVLSSKKERLISLTAQLKAESSSSLDTMKREVDSIAYSISELKSTIEDLKKQDSATGSIPF